MFKKLSKRGQTGLIVVVLIILVGIVIFIIFWNIFNPFLMKGAKETDTDIFKNEFEIREAGLFMTGASRVNVLRKSGNSSIDSLKFVFEDESRQSYSESVNENIPALLEIRSYFFSPIENFGKIKKISVYPVIDEKIGIGSSIESDFILDIPYGLVSLWKFNGDLEDFSGKNTGKINGNVEFVENEGKKSIYSYSGFVDLGNDSSLNVNKEFAIAFWIKTSSKNAVILRKGILNPNYKIIVDEDGKIEFSFSSKGDIKSGKTSKTIGDEKWHHLVITNMMAYIDGEADKIININDVLDTNQENLIVGEGFDGFISKLMFFNRSLDMNQAKGIYNLNN